MGSANAESYTNRITLYAPEAPATAWTAVQFQSPDGAWHTVDGWQGNLDTLADSDLRLKTWAVSPDNGDEGPFRWVVYTSQGGDVWGISDSFNLPGGGNVNLEATVHAASAATDTTGAEATPVAPTAAPAASPAPDTDVSEAPPVASDASTWFFDCLDCDHSLITVYLPDTPIGSAVRVEYQLPDGSWHVVESWQTTLAANDSGTPFVQWSVGEANFDQGPFRWVVANPDGSLWGVSKTFNLPDEGVNYILFLLRH